MGAFSNVDYELQNNEAAVSNAFMEDDDMDMPQTVPAEPTTGSFPPDTELAPATAVSEPSAVSDTQSEDEARRAHEAAEAKRKAEWDARQAEKQRAEQAALEKLDAMSPAELLKAAAKRVSADTEKLTRRNMKESVSEFIQTKCIDDLDFARLTMHPRKSMIHCFQYISRKACDYVQDELKANGVQPGPGQQGYGCDIPDDLCYQWAEDYFRDPDAKEDQGDEEKFVRSPIVGKHLPSLFPRRKRKKRRTSRRRRNRRKKRKPTMGRSRWVTSPPLGRQPDVCL